MAIQAPGAATLAFLERSPFQLFIGGQWVGPVEGGKLRTYNPSDGACLAELAAAGPADVEAAVAAARGAYAAGWGRTAPADREAPLRRLGDLITAHADELAELEALDNGKPLRKARAIDVRVAARIAHHFSGWPGKIAG